MDFVVSCSLQNDAGIVLMCQERYKDAIASFSDTLELIKCNIATSSRASEASAHSEPHLVWQYGRIHSKPLKDLPILFNFFVSFSSRMEENDIDVDGTCLELSQGLVFNMALAHHIGAIHGSLPTQSFAKAKSLYQLARTIQSSEPIEVPLAHHMAILNNLGQLYAIHEQKKASRRYFDQLLKLVVYAHGQAGSLFESQEDDIFLENALKAIMVHGSAPAA